jgi:hypothetical protein
MQLAGTEWMTETNGSQEDLLTATTPDMGCMFVDGWRGVV